VAEDAVLGQPAGQRALERVDVVDALADERAFAEQVLVDVGNGTRVRIDAGLAAVQACVARAVGARQAQADARLQDAVALDDDVLAAAGAEHRPVQRDAPSSR
jgi:hypothetical protein